jgi:hypothetical protein
MSRANKYRKQAALGIVGLLCIASPLFAKLPSQYQAFKADTDLETKTAIANARIRNSEDAYRSRIEQKRKTADKLKETGVIPTGQKLRIRRYYDDPKLDPKPDTTGYLEDEKVYVYDSSGVCIGRIQKREWYWKYYYKNSVCDGSPAL